MCVNSLSAKTMCLSELSRKIIFFKYCFDLITYYYLTIFTACSKLKAYHTVLESGASISIRLRMFLVHYNLFYLFLWLPLYLLRISDHSWTSFLTKRNMLRYIFFNLLKSCYARWKNVEKFGKLSYNKIGLLRLTTKRSFF